MRNAHVTTTAKSTASPIHNNHMAKFINTPLPPSPIDHSWSSASPSSSASATSSPRNHPLVRPRRHYNYQRASPTPVLAPPAPIVHHAPAPAPAPAPALAPAPVNNPYANSLTDVIGFVYCPPGWDEHRLRSGPDAEAIGKIAMDTYTDISYIKDKNAIQISGETHDDVYKAQNQLNSLFFPVIVKSKRQWARPDRPGSWGQRRDSSGPGPAPGPHGGLRKMKSESALGMANRPLGPHGPAMATQQAQAVTGWR
ncbi:hypothetical protein HDU96_000039 [Phlyctochytrium bullatum]|nr:hypothetical protein HDU96_000039 [Phlyctochytrium bullatum]